MEPPPILGQAFGTRFEHQRRRLHLRHVAVLIRSEFRHVAYLHRPQEVTREHLVGVPDDADVVRTHPVKCPPVRVPLPLDVIHEQLAVEGLPRRVLLVHRSVVVIDAHLRVRPEQLQQRVQIVGRLLGIVVPHPAGGQIMRPKCLDVRDRVEYIVRLRAHGLQHLQGVVADQPPREETSPFGMRLVEQSEIVASAAFPLLFDVDILVVEQTHLGFIEGRRERVVGNDVCLLTVRPEEERPVRETDALQPRHVEGERKKARLPLPRSRPLGGERSAGVHGRILETPESDRESVKSEGRRDHARR